MGLTWEEAEVAALRAGLTIWGPHTNVKRGPFSHTHTQYFLSRSALFFFQKLDDLF